MPILLSNLSLLGNRRLLNTNERLPKGEIDPGLKGCGGLYGVSVLNVRGKAQKSAKQVLSWH